jgi:hypothetical protein
MTFINTYPALQPFTQQANHIDVKKGVVLAPASDLTLRQFVVGAMNYSPAWLKFLYHLRGWFVPLLGLRQEGVPQVVHQTPAGLSMTAGGKCHIFTIATAQEGAHWIAEASDKHLTAYLGVVQEPLTNQQTQFHMVTVVHYHHWTGPVYFNVIRPFHHLVVQKMLEAGLRAVKG